MIRNVIINNRNDNGCGSKGGYEKSPRMPYGSPDKGAIWVKIVGMITHVPATTVNIRRPWIDAGISPDGSVVNVIDMDVFTIVYIYVYVFLAFVYVYFIPVYIIGPVA